MIQGKKILDPESRRELVEALMLKTWRCPPSQLYEEDADEIEIKSFIYGQMMKKDPMSML